MCAQFFKRYYCIKQHDISDCGAACLAIVAKQYGLKLPISYIREIAGTDQKGTNAFGMIKAAKEIGFSAKGVKAQAEHLTSQLPLPTIAHVVKDNLLHYVVIHEINKKGLIIADPAEGIKKYSREEFLKIWSGVLILLVPEERFEKGDKTTGLFGRFFSLITPHKRLLIEIFLASILFTILGIIGAFYFKFLIDEVLIEGMNKTLHLVSVGMIVLVLFRVFLNAFRSHLLSYLSQKIDIALILQYYQHVLKLPLSFFDSRKVGEILSRLSDASKIRNAISGATLTVMIDTLMVIAGGIVLYIQSGILFGISAVLIPFYVLIVLIFNKSFRDIHRKEMEQAADTEAYLVESISGVSTIKAFNGEEEASLETEKRFLKFIRSIFKAVWLRNIQSSFQLVLTLVGEIVILWVGGIQVIKGAISLGELITFNALLAYFFEPIQNLINVHPLLQEAFVAADRLGEILDLKVEKENEHRKINLQKIKGKIEFRDVSFRYGTRELVLKKINLTIQPGEKVALVGESGSGKTTLVKLLLKFYLPEEGEILIDGFNIKDLNLDSLRERIGYVPQDVFLFSGSIYDNIAFGQKLNSPTQIIEAAQKAQAHDFINRLPLRYETPVGERGSNLSGGQKQRIAIARAILKKPDLLILDEATSNLDSITENIIHQTIEEICKDITTIIIAHRLSTVRKSDRIVFLEGGEIVEMGSHEELLAKKGRYYMLWQGQTSVEREVKIS